MKNSIAFITLITLSLAACNAGRDRTNIELIQGMMDQPSLKAQDWDSKRNTAAVRVPPAGTKPIGKNIYKHSFESAATLNNPLPLNLDALARGQKAYQVYCQVCHGPKGRGDGRIANKLAVAVADLQGDRVKNEYAPGQLFHVITEGYGQMRGYKTIITRPEDRWAIVHYVRHLNK